MTQMIMLILDTEIKKNKQQQKQIYCTLYTQHRSTYVILKAIWNFEQRLSIVEYTNRSFTLSSFFHFIVRFYHFHSPNKTTLESVQVFEEHIVFKQISYKISKTYSNFLDFVIYIDF